MVYYRRQLPHWHPKEAWLFITFRLQGSMPRSQSQPNMPGGEAFLRWDRELDSATTGPVWLKDARIAGAVVGTITQAADRELCELGAFVVMVNHVHLLVCPKVPPPKLTQWIKGVSAKRANEILHRTGQQFWQHESYDHYVRTSDQWGRIVHYIEDNPVNAGLADLPQAWRWSSAHLFIGTS